MPANLCPSKLADRHHDGIPDSIDPYPNDFFNNGPGYFFPALDSNGAATVVAYPMEADNHLVYFYSAPYYAAWADRDGDGIPDDADPHPDDYYNGTDTDGDGIPDSVEVAHGLNPYDASDASNIRYIAGQTDGLTWKQAYDHKCLDAFMDPNLDADADGMSDLYEIINGLDPNNSFDAVDAPVGHLNQWDAVTMNDFILNIEKARAGVPLSHIVTDQNEYYQITGHQWNGPPPHNYQLSVAENDWDGDGVSNGDEVLVFRSASLPYGTNPHDASSIPNDDDLGAAYLAGLTSVTTSLSFLTIFSNVDSDHNGLADWVQVKYHVATNEANNIRYIYNPSTGQLETDGLTWIEAWQQHYLTLLKACSCGGTTCGCAHALCCTGSSACGGTLPNCSCGGDQCSCAPATTNACGSNSGPCFKCKCAGDKCACADSTVCVGKTDQCKSCTCGGKHCSCANKTVCGGDKTKCECECGGDKCACTTPNACGTNTDQCKPCVCGGNACTCANATVCKGNSSGCQQAICSCTGAGCICQTDMACRTNTAAHCLAPAVSITASSSSIAPNNNNDEGRPEPTGTEDPPVPFPQDNDNETMLTSDPDIVQMVVTLDRANTTGGTLTLHVPVGYRVFNGSGSVLATTAESETDVTLDKSQLSTTLYVEGLDNVSGGEFKADFDGYSGGGGGGHIEDKTTTLPVLVQGLGTNDEIVGDWLMGEADPTPNVEMQLMGAQVTGGNLQVHLQGKVYDALSNLAKKDEDKVQTLSFTLFGQTLKTISLSGDFEAGVEFNETVTIEGVDPSSYTIRAETSQNKAQNTAWSEVAVSLGAVVDTPPALQGTNPNANPVTVTAPESFSETVPNDLAISINTADAQVFSGNVTETGPNTRIFTGDLGTSESPLPCTVRIRGPVSLNGQPRKMEAIVLYTLANGKEYRTSLTLTETVEGSRQYSLGAADDVNVSYHLDVMATPQFSGSQNELSASPVTLRIGKSADLESQQVLKLKVGNVEYPIKKFSIGTAGECYYPYDPDHPEEPKQFLPSSKPVPDHLTVPGYPHDGRGGEIVFSLITDNGETVIANAEVEPTTPKQVASDDGDAVAMSAAASAAPSGTTEQGWQKPGDTITKMDLLTAFEFLYGPKGMILYDCYNKAGGNVTLKHWWWGGPLEVKGLGFFNTLEIQIENQSKTYGKAPYHPIVAAQLLWSGLCSSSALLSVRKQLDNVSTNDTTVEDYVNEIKMDAWHAVGPAACQAGIAGTTIYLSGIGLMSDGVNFILIMNDVKEGHMSALAAALPFIPGTVFSKGGKLIVKETTGVEIGVIESEERLNKIKNLKGKKVEDIVPVLSESKYKKFLGELIATTGNSEVRVGGRELLSKNLESIELIGNSARDVDLIHTLAMLSLTQAQRSDRLMKAATSLTVAEFDALVAEVDRLWNGLHFEHTAEGQLRVRQPGGGRKGVLDSPARKLFFILFYYKAYPTQDLMGLLFGITQGQVSDWVARLTTLVGQFLPLHKPARKVRELRELVAREPALREVIIDGTERRVPRPVHAGRQRRYYSGRKKRHAVKNVLVTGAGKVRWCSRTVPARVHDKTLAEREKLRLPRGVSLLGDSGFAGLQAGEADLITPWKKPRGRRLHKKRRAFNRLLSRERIHIEHTLSSVKRLRILRDDFRNRRAGMVDAVMEFGCTLHNYRWSCRQEAAAA